jgi:hypothetical protein
MELFNFLIQKFADKTAVFLLEAVDQALMTLEILVVTIKVETAVLAEAAVVVATAAVPQYRAVVELVLFLLQ